MRERTEEEWERLLGKRARAGHKDIHTFCQTGSQATPCAASRVLSMARLHLEPPKGSAALGEKEREGERGEKKGEGYERREGEGGGEGGFGPCLEGEPRGGLTSRRGAVGRGLSALSGRLRW